MKEDNATSFHVLSKEYEESHWCEGLINDESCPREGEGIYPSPTPSQTCPEPVEGWEGAFVVRESTPLRDG